MMRTRLEVEQSEEDKRTKAEAAIALERRRRRRLAAKDLTECDLTGDGEAWTSQQTGLPRPRYIKTAFVDVSD
jgi:hypothetical protein